MDFRAYVDRDRGALMDLWEVCGLNVAHNDPGDMIDRKKAFQPELLLVGDVEGRLVATVMAGYEGRRGWLNLLAVHPDFRGRGLGTAMVLEAERRLTALGCPKVNLQVRATNAGVVAFYGKLGYEVEEVVSMGKRL